MGIVGLIAQGEDVGEKKPLGKQHLEDKVLLMLPPECLYFQRLLSIVTGTTLCRASSSLT